MNLTEVVMLMIMLSLSAIIISSISLTVSRVNDLIDKRLCSVVQGEVAVCIELVNMHDYEIVLRLSPRIMVAHKGNRLLILVGHHLLALPIPQDVQVAVDLRQREVRIGSYEG
ncbi:MAG: hypothetical protein DRN15_03445 [Thermoprotei archaeon]|nr:MAG: hypothetical protein DRN15_03445 [Thermoprotei archaeon]RLF25403.1 MAG: hypothetical protein DRM97_01905 [Thermoprotei archaeon]